MTYDQWEAQQRLSPSSPEACAAEAAWNAAMTEARNLVNAALPAEATKVAFAVLLDTELELLITDFGTSY